MSDRKRDQHCIGILMDETIAVLADELRDESLPIPPITEAFRRLDRPAVLRILNRTLPQYRAKMAGFVVHHRPDLREYVDKCLKYLGGECQRLLSRCRGGFRR